MLDDVAASNMPGTSEVFVDQANVGKYGAKLPVPAPRKAELERPVP